MATASTARFRRSPNFADPHRSIDGLAHVKIVSPATVTAVSASISTPVRSIAVTVARNRAVQIRLRNLRLDQVKTRL